MVREGSCVCVCLLDCSMVLKESRQLQKELSSISKVIVPNVPVESEQLWVQREHIQKIYKHMTRVSFLSNLFEKHIQKDHVQDKKLK